MCVDKFLENVKLTLTLKISLKVLNSDALVKRLNESTIDIHTVEIESTCKLNQVLSRYSLPFCLKVLRINDNNLNVGDISDLVRSLSGVNSLHELDLRRTKFEEGSFYAFTSVLSISKDLRSLSLTDNGLTKPEIAGLITTFKSIKNLEKLNLSKSNIAEAQANDMLQKFEQANNIGTLDLSHNALQGNEIVIRICQLQSLEEVDLSRNYIRFSPLPNFKGKHESLSTKTKIISLAYSHMTPFDISQFCSLIRSDLLRLNLDFNHVSTSVLSLCSLGLRIKHLKVLSLANTNISEAVHGLAALLSLVGELEELNLSSNNLTLADFQKLQLPLSNLSQLQSLNLSNNPDGIAALLEWILPSLKNLKQLRLSNTHLNGDDLKRICQSLASFMDLRYLELSMNAIGPDGIKELANILQEFPLLERLDLSRSCLQGDDINVLCQGLVPLKKIKYLDLSGNVIDSQILDDAWLLPPTLEELIFSDVIHGEKLFAKIKPLRSLKKLHLHNLKLRACDVEMLTTTLASYSKLEELSLADIAIADFNCDKIFSAIKSLGNIRKIDLSDIKLYDESTLADMLSSLLFLEELVLTGMSVVSMDDVRFFSAIKLLKRLRKLDLGNIDVHEEKAFFDMLSSLSMLEEIVFPAVALENSDGTVGYFSALASLRYLKNLDLRWSKICKSAEEALTCGLLSLRLLQRLVFGTIDRDIEKLFTALGNLKYLKELDLGTSHVDVTGLNALARVLPSLTLLEKLRAEFYLGNEWGEQLCAALGDLKYLKELRVRLTIITKPDVEAFARMLSSLTMLEKLVLRYMSQYDEQLFAALRNLKYLKELDLSKTYSTKPDAIALAGVFPSLMFLEKLAYGGFHRDDKCSEQLFAATTNLKYLKELRLDLMNVTKTGQETFVRVLPSLTLLEKLVLETIRSDGECDEQLFAALGNLKYLKELHLEVTFFTKPGAEALARVLPLLRLLEKLVLKCFFCFRNYKCDEELLAALGNLKCVKKLRLKLLGISEIGVEALARALPSLQLLKELQLKRITWKGDKQLLHALGELRYLEKLELYENKITKAGVACLADVLPSLGFLKKLLFRLISFRNTSDEQLFTAVGSLSFLNDLDLSFSVITQAGAAALTTTLPRLGNLKCFFLPRRIANVEDEILEKNLEAAASFVPKVHKW